jgi:hypothetical protein
MRRFSPDAGVAGFPGREEAAIRELIAARAAAATLAIIVDRIQFVRGDVALVEGTWCADKPGPRRPAIYLVHRRDDRWAVAWVHIDKH